MQQNNDSKILQATAWAVLAVLIGSIAIAYANELDRAAYEMSDQQLMGHYRDSVYRAANVGGVE